MTTQMKRVLCISVNGSNVARMSCGVLADWDMCIVSDLEGAGRALRDQRFVVGLLIDIADAHCTTEMDRFLRQHASVQWVGILAPRTLESRACRELVIDHLCDFHTNPVDPLRLAHTLGHAYGWAMLRERPRVALRRDAAEPMTGECAAIKRLRSHIRKVALVNAPVLIGGESGSGKELTALAIHAHSTRAKGPFVPINCGAIPASLVQSELFGYERGAFTGASKGKAGLIESAQGGTVFLDEIGDLPKDLQSNLLRFLQEGTIHRVGATRSTAVDARVIAASHVNLQQAVAQGLFREDLFYRLNVLPIEVPPLRERKADLPALAEHFFDTYAVDKGAHIKGFSGAAMQAMIRHDWPGNVRELINRIRRALVLAEGRLITPGDLDLTDHCASPPGEALKDSLVRAERIAICASLNRAGTVASAALDLGVSRMTLYRLLAKHHITF
jgi:DNA-binding NtrC family response regulator